MTRERAQVLALLALGWIAGHETLGPVFLGATGASPDDLRRGATDPAFLAGVLSFLTQSDPWVTEFCDAEGIGYDEPLRARMLLSGETHWT